MISERVDQYINSNPRHALTFLLLSFCILIHLPATILGVMIYLIAVKKYKISHWILLCCSAIAFAELFYFVCSHTNEVELAKIIKETFQNNWILVSFFFKTKYSLAFKLLLQKLLVTTLYVPFLIASIISLIQLIPKPAHAATLKALKNGLLQREEKELSAKEIQKALQRLPTDHPQGTVLGVSMFSGQPVILPDNYVNQVALVLGTTGSGKTVTLNRFYQHAIQQGHPLIVVDGKPDFNNIYTIRKFAEKYNRKFYGFNCENNCHYDPLACGGYTELKDKMICLKEEWSSDYYRSIAEDYLQTTIEVILNTSEPLILRRIVECLNYDELKSITRSTKKRELISKVSLLANYNQNDITGLQAHFNILINSELGKYFEYDENKFSIDKAIQETAVIYFALPALRFPSFSKVLGKLVINDIKGVIDRQNCKNKKIFTIFDEFSIFAGEQVLNLINMGRGKGVHAILGTQGLADLDMISQNFTRQLLNCTNTILCHQLNDNESAEAISNWIGTRDVFTLTGQINHNEMESELGSVRINKEFIVHPDEIKRGLTTGQIYYCSKASNIALDKVQVKFN